MGCETSKQVESERLLGRKMIDQFINFVIRPPRADYSPGDFLWKAEFTLAGRKYERKDLELKNGRGHILKCSHYVPSPFPENTPLPCVIYCHGNRKMILKLWCHFYEPTSKSHALVFGADRWVLSQAFFMEQKTHLLLE